MCCMGMWQVFYTFCLFLSIGSKCKRLDGWSKRYLPVLAVLGFLDSCIRENGTSPFNYTIYRVCIHRHPEGSAYVYYRVAPTLGKWKLEYSYRFAPRYLFLTHCARKGLLLRPLYACVDDSLISTSTSSGEQYGNPTSLTTHYKTLEGYMWQHSHHVWLTDIGGRRGMMPTTPHCQCKIGTTGFSQEESGWPCHRVGFLEADGLALLRWWWGIEELSDVLCAGASRFKMASHATLSTFQKICTWNSVCMLCSICTSILWVEAMAAAFRKCPQFALASPSFSIEFCFFGCVFHQWVQMRSILQVFSFSLLAFGLQPHGKAMTLGLLSASFTIMLCKPVWLLMSVSSLSFSLVTFSLAAAFRLLSYCP